MPRPRPAQAQGSRGRIRAAVGDPIDRPDPARPGRWHARHEGFDLHAAIVVPAGAHDRLERLCRYASRSPLGQDRTQRMPDGTVVRLELRRRWTDGTTHLIFDPVELLERLSRAACSRPRINLVLYHGVFAPRAAWRAAIVPARGPETAADSDRASIPPDGDHGHAQPSNRSWADLVQRSLGFDVLACPRCTGRLRLVALIHNPAVVHRILHHLGLPETPPAVRPSRAPPLADDWIDDPRFCCE